MRRGRKARLERPPVQSAVAPGHTGDQYQPLTDPEIQNIHRTIDEKIRNRFPIEVPRESMNAGSSRWQNL